jgi:hypothetical protein
MRSSQITTQIHQNSMQQVKYKKRFKSILASIASLMTVTGLSMMPASAELSSVDPEKNELDTENNSEYTGYPKTTGGFPRWYTEKNSTRPGGPLKLGLCVDSTLDPLCLAAPQPDPDSPISFPDNFPDEAFWWTAEAETTITPGGARALLVLATEAAFGNGDPVDGDQIVFNRTRIRILGGLTAGRWYRITYPYGTKDLQATTRDPRKPATINVTEDFGCAPSLVAICNFGSVLVAKGRGGVTNPIGNPLLTWTTFKTNLDSPDPVISGKYVGDPNVDSRITGSPIPNSSHPSGYQNFFKVELLSTTTPRTVVRQIAYTDLFSVSGKVYQPPTTP